MKNHFFLLLVFLFALGTSLTSCGPDDDIDIITPAEDLANLKAYLAENNIDAVERASGLHYVIDEPGNSVNPEPNSTVRVSYTGKLTDGTVFDSRPFEDPLRINLGNAIQGWREGIPLFGIEGKGKLYIPSYLGYGSRPVGIIPPNSILVFDINLQGIE